MIEKDTFSVFILFQKHTRIQRIFKGQRSTSALSFSQKRMIISDRSVGMETGHPYRFPVGIPGFRPSQQKYIPLLLMFERDKIIKQPSHPISGQRFDQVTPLRIFKAE